MYWLVRKWLPKGYQRHQRKNKRRGQRQKTWTFISDVFSISKHVAVSACSLDVRILTYVPAVHKALILPETSKKTTYHYQHITQRPPIEVTFHFNCEGESGFLFEVGGVSEGIEAGLAPKAAGEGAVASWVHPLTRG